MTEQPIIPFTLTRAVREWAFVQAPLLALNDFRSEVKARGLDQLGLFEQASWETLDREGLLEPVAYAFTDLWRHDLQGALDDDLLRIREQLGYVPWAELTEQVPERWGQPGDLLVLYHRWQVMAVGELQAALTAALPWASLRDGLEVFYEQRARFAAAPASAPRDQLTQIADECRRRELLLVAVQNMLWPSQRGGPGQSRYVGGQVLGLTDEAADWAHEQWRTADFGRLAAECGVDRDELAGIYDRMLWHAQRLDPNAEMVELLSQLKRAKREKLKGRARLAVDWYDGARMVRAWHHLIDPEQPLLPDIDEHNGAGTEYKRRRFGTVDTDGNRRVLPILLEEYGLYPWRVNVIGEGESELAALRVVVEEGYGLSFEHLGILTTDIEGADIPANAELLLSAMHRYVNYFLLVFDDEGRAVELIEELQRRNDIEGISDERRRAFNRQLLEATAQISDKRARAKALSDARQRARRPEATAGEAPEFVLWHENFEADNFTDEELVLVANQFIPDPPGGAHPISVADLQRGIAKHPKKGIASVLVDIAESHLFRVDKPKLAERLAVYALDHPQPGGARRQLLELGEHLIRLAGADRRLAGRLRDHDSG